jgi:hypothetical protein
MSIELMADCVGKVAAGDVSQISLLPRVAVAGGPAGWGRMERC